MKFSDFFFELNCNAITQNLNTGLFKVGLGVKMSEHDSGDKDIYSEKGREDLVEDDAIEPWEEGFMRGAEGLGQDAKCGNCGEIFMSTRPIVETEIDGEVMKFCSEECVQEYKKSLQGQQS